MKLLASRPTARYPSADDLRTDLRRFREGLPVAARSGPAPPPPPRSRRPCAHHGHARRWPPPRPSRSSRRRVVPAGTVPPGGGQYDEPRRNGSYVLGGVLAVLLHRRRWRDPLQHAEGQQRLAQVTVLSFMNKPIDQAKQQVQAQGLLALEDPQENDAVAVGVVYAQDPAAGRRSTRARRSS